MEKMYGWTKKEALGKVAHQLLRTEFPQPHGVLRANLLERGQWEGELIHFRKDGQRITVASQWVLHTDAAGRPAAILEINNDITERKSAEEQILKLNTELEQRVQERTAELTSANRELEAFTYSVAHDLRAPLRHIDAFTKILHEDFAASLPQEAQRYLEKICNGSRNMSRLVDDLLNLARVGRQELRRQSTSLNTLIGEVLTDLKRETEGRNIEWHINPLPMVEADSGLLKQVFANLLANAAKYTRPRQVAIVEVGSIQKNGDLAVFVRDNGVGFNMKYADKLFGVFQRLHRPEEFEGTGVGLATVERIIRRHGGSVWAEAAVGQGATFYFTLPGQSSEKEQGSDGNVHSVVA
jgi:PAS domain S-box-containing protein